MGGEKAMVGADSSSRSLTGKGRRKAGQSLEVEEFWFEGHCDSWEVALEDRHNELSLILISRSGCHKGFTQPRPSLVATGHESLRGPEAAGEPGPGRV